MSTGKPIIWDPESHFLERSNILCPYYGESTIGSFHCIHKYINILDTKFELLVIASQW